MRGGDYALWMTMPPTDASWNNTRSQWGLQSATASDGYQALALLKDAATRGEPFDLAILDLQMPRMDGLELGRTITADPVLAATRLVLLTSIGLRGQAEKAKQAGISAYLTKPVHRAHLYDCLTMIVDLPAKSATDPLEIGAASRPHDVLVTRHVLKEAAGGGACPHPCGRGQYREPESRGVSAGKARLSGRCRGQRARSGRSGLSGQVRAWS